MRRSAMLAAPPWSRCAPCSTRRPAYSLIELVVAIGLITVLMTVSGALFAALARSERNAVRSASVQQTISRLDGLFRRDVHRCNSAFVDERDGAPPALTLQRGQGESIRYAAAKGDLERIAQTGDAVHRETFRIPGADWTLEVSDDEPRWVTLILERPADSLTQTGKGFLPTRIWRFKALLSATPASMNGDAP